MRVLAKEEHELRGPQGLWRNQVAPSNAPLAVPRAEILGKGDGQIAPIGAFWFYALPIAHSAATEPAPANDGGRRMGEGKCLPFSSPPLK